MKIKATILSLAFVVFTWSANSNAALIGNMGFTMYDPVGMNSWTVDLGVSVNDAISGALDGQSFDVLSLLDVAGANSQIGDLSGYVWSVAGAVPNNLVASLSGPSFDFSSSADLVTVNTNLDQYWTDNGNETNEAIGMGDAGYYDNFYQGNINGATGVSRNLEATVGTVMDLYAFNGGSVRPIVLPTSEFLTQVSFLGTGILQFGTDPINPIPLPAAVWFLGSALLGLVGFVRKRQNQSVQEA